MFQLLTYDPPSFFWISADEGTVTRTGSVKMLEAAKGYICKKCNHEFVVHADVENQYIMAAPSKCPSMKDTPCKSTEFDLQHEKKICKDFQEIVIQEQVQKLTVGMIPRSIVVILEDDLADSCKAGDDIAVTGQLIRRWKKVSKGIKIDIEIALHANYCQIYNGSKVRGLSEGKYGFAVPHETCFQLFSLLFVLIDQKNDFHVFWESHQSNPLAGELYFSI
jgi:DNA replicative helicase MCM subunit Mcm2 (Cdc46/Mcm family)